MPADPNQIRIRNYHRDRAIVRKILASDGGLAVEHMTNEQLSLTLTQALGTLARTAVDSREVDVVRAIVRASGAWGELLVRGEQLKLDF